MERAMPSSGTSCSHSLIASSAANLQAAEGSLARISETPQPLEARRSVAAVGSASAVRAARARGSGEDDSLLPPHARVVAEPELSLKYTT